MMSPWGRCSEEDTQPCSEKLSSPLSVPLPSVPQRSAQTSLLPVVAMVVGVATAVMAVMAVMVVMVGTASTAAAISTTVSAAVASASTVAPHTTVAIAAGGGMAGRGFGFAEPIPVGMLLHY
jgi:hypothetical protein